MISCWFPLARGDLYSCEPIRSIRNRVISKCGFPSNAGISFLAAIIWPRNEPLLLLTNMSGCSRSQSRWMKSRASCGCRGRSGANTCAWPLRLSFKAMAGTHAPEAKKPWRKRTLCAILTTASVNVACRSFVCGSRA